MKVTELEYYAYMANSLTYHFKGTNVDLGTLSLNTCKCINIQIGTACGKFHRVAVCTILDPGDSDILSVNQAEAWWWRWFWTKMFLIGENNHYY